MKLAIALGILIAGAQAMADVVCEGQSQLGKVQVTYNVSNQAVTVAGDALEKEAVYTNAHAVWDGHATGLVTAEGFAMRFNNFFGCIRNASITTNLRSGAHGPMLIETFEIKTCRGGSTPDRICLGQK